MTDPRHDPDAPGAPRGAWLVGGAIVAGLTYLVWRIGWTRNGTRAGLFWVLWLAEASVWVNLLRFVHDGWHLRFDRRRRTAQSLAVDVVVVCRDEPVEVLRATVLGCAAMDHPHRLVVVDTLGRAELHRRLGAAAEVLHLPFPMVQPVEVVLNHLADELHGDLVTVLPGDQVPLPHMLSELVGDFDDEAVWVAQGRHAVYGPSPGEYPGSATEQDLFFKVIQPGKNHHGAAYWCGAGGLVRRTALDELGGVPVRTDTPTFELSIAAAGAGWRSTYHDAPVVLSLARPDLDGFIAQRSIWAHGDLQVLRTPNNPLLLRGLRPGQRLSYVATLLNYLAGPRRLVFMAILCATLLLGALPLQADPVVLLAAWGAWMALLAGAHRVLGRGLVTGVGTGRHRWLLIGAYVSAWVGLLVPRRVVLALRNPPATAGHRLTETTPRMRLLVAGIAAVAISAVARIAALLGVADLPALPDWATWLSLAAAAWMVGSLTTLVRTATRRSRRRQTRFPVDAVARVGSTAHAVLDLGEGGASVRFRRPPRIGCPYIVALQVPGLDGGTHQATVAAEVRSVRRFDDSPGSGFVVGLAFTHMSERARERVTEYCRTLMPARAAVDPVPESEELDLDPRATAAVQSRTQTG